MYCSASLTEADDSFASAEGQATTHMAAANAKERHEQLRRAWSIAFPFHPQAAVAYRGRSGAAAPNYKAGASLSPSRIIVNHGQGVQSKPSTSTVAPAPAELVEEPVEPSHPGGT